MSRAAVANRARARTPAEWLALAAGLAVFLHLGWDLALWDARLQLLLHLVAVGTIGGVAVNALRGGLVPSTKLDVPLLALLAAFAVATASALSVGMSLRAMASITAYAAMLPVALIAVRLRPSWVGVVTSLPVLVLAIPTLLVLLSRRLDWILVGAPGLPPLRLPAEGTPFGSVAVPPFVIWPAWALAGLIESPAWRRPIRIGLVAVGIPLTVLSGSRSAWLAIAATAVVVGIPWAWSERGRLRTLVSSRMRVALVAVGALAVAAAGIVLVLPRLTAVTSIVYRVDLWRDTLVAWATDPLFGIGPGFMAYARQAAAPDLSFPVRQPHSHNLPLGVLGDAGIVGLVAAVAAVVTLSWVAGPWRARTATGRAAGIVLVGLAFGGLTEDLTFLPNFNLLAIALIAVVLTDAGAVRWVRLPPLATLRGRLATAAAAVIGVVLVAAMVVADAGAVAYRLGEDAAEERDWDAATRWFATSAEIDPWHPLPPKALAVAAAADGQLALARRAAEAAVALNPGDGAAWTNLALLCAALDDRDCHLRALERVTATASLGGPELANAALRYEALGRAEAADDAYRRSLLTQRLTAFALDWPRDVAVGDEPLSVAGPEGALNLVLARWATGDPIEPSAVEPPRARAVAHAILGERDAAATALAEAIRQSPDEPLTWEVAIVLREHWGEPTGAERAIAEVVRGGPLPERDRPNEVPAVTRDIASFRRIPLDGLVPSAERLRTSTPWLWVLERALPQQTAERLTGAALRAEGAG